MRAPLVNENSSSSLGLLGAAGCVGLLGWLLFRPRPRPATDAPSPLHNSLDALAVLNGVALLYGTIGGLSMVFAFFVSPQIRSVNRISVFIAFFSLAAVAACLDRWCVRPGRSWPVRAAGWLGLILLTAAGLLDQGPWHLDLDRYREVTKEFRADRGFFRGVQAAVPAGTMVFELPYEVFPEVAPPVGTMLMDTEFRAYVQTMGLRWSYGAVKNTTPDLWQQHIAALPLDEGLRTLAYAGFGGVLLECNGYADRGVAAEATLRERLGPPVVGRSEELFFTLVDYTRTLRAGLSDAQWQEAADIALHPLVARFDAGFTGPESKDGRKWYWCGPAGKLTLFNGGSGVRHARLSMQAQTGRGDPAHLTMRGAGVDQTWTITRALQPLTIALELPPGETVIAFTCDGQPVDAPLDVRVMVWSPVNFQVEDVAADATGQPR